MIYWVAETAETSIRLCYEERHDPWRLAAGERIQVPTGIANLPGETIRRPRSWAERIYDVQHGTTMPEGGHSSALEVACLPVEAAGALARRVASTDSTATAHRFAGVRRRVEHP